MNFAKLVFRIAGIYGVLALAPLYFVFEYTGRAFPPAINHPEFYYGFAGVALAWQIGFLVMAADPVRFRPLMIPAGLEKVLYAGAIFALYTQGRVGAIQLATAGADSVFAILFVAAFVKTARS
jgi:hypothetical protein